MKKEVILVPKGKSPLDVVLGEIGKRIGTSWIFLHENVYQELSKTSDLNSRTNAMNDQEHALMKWNATKDDPEIVISCNVPKITWGKIRSIEVAGVSYGMYPSDPEDIYFLKMGK